MAKGRKTGGRDWKPGETGNPKGGPGLPKDLRDARKVNQAELERTINRLIWMPLPNLLEHINATTTPMFDRFVGNIIALGAEEGDERRMEFILQRIIGKVQDRIEVKTPTPFVIKRPSGDVVEVGAEMPKDEE